MKLKFGDRKTMRTEKIVFDSEEVWIYLNKYVQAMILLNSSKASEGRNILKPFWKIKCNWVCSKNTFLHPETYVYLCVSVLKKQKIDAVSFIFTRAEFFRLVWIF